MTDFAIAVQNGIPDLVFADGDLVIDESLLPAILLSLMTDRLAEPNDVLPDGSTDHRGWWADAYLEGGDRFGSRLWLLNRAKNVPDEVRRAREYAQEALAWLIEDGIAAEVNVTASVPKQGWLHLQIVITRRDGSLEEFTIPLDTSRGAS